MIYGYARVSRDDQDLTRQLNQLNAAGCEQIFEEKASGVKNNRKEYMLMKLVLKPGDTVIVTELTRLSRSTIELLNTLQEFEKNGVAFKNLNGLVIDTASPSNKAMSKLMMTLLAAISEFERDLLIERINDGLSVAKANGHISGRPQVKRGKIKFALEMYASGGKTVKEICDDLGIGEATFYRYLRKSKVEAVTKEKG